MRQYHTISRDWITNEIVRRVDPNHRTISAILSDDVCGPLGVNVALGIHPDSKEAALIVPVQNVSVLWTALQSLLPVGLGRKVPWGSGWCFSHLWSEIQKNVIDRSNIPFEAPFGASPSAGIFFW